MKRAKDRSCAMVREAVQKGEEVLEIVNNEVCHICHNRKEMGLTFHCGRHSYCDFHCASRLSFRVHDYDKNNPTCIPIDYCPVCTLYCTCAKCTRRLEDVAGKMKIECQKQNCTVHEVVMDNMFELCSSKLKGDRESKLKASSGASASNNKKKGSSKKVTIEDGSLAETAGGGGMKRGRSDEEDYAGYVPRQSTSRSTRSSPPMADEPSDTRPKKKKKLEPAVPVPVLKVPPSEFPKEMYGAQDLDPSVLDDLNKVFTPDGSFPVEDANTVGLQVKKQKYQQKLEMAVDGNFYQCAVCNKDNGDETFICCKKCPRSYHKECFEDSCNSGDSESANDSGVKRECKRCEWDDTIRPEEDITSGVMKVDKKILKAYAKYKGTESHTFMSIMICELLQILGKLTIYDYGHIFSYPVDTASIPDYLTMISKPMDYGTIIGNLEKGRYSPSSDSPSSTTDGENNMDAMEDIVLNALMDIEQVHHNCLLYNLRGTPFHRAGEVQASKWKAYFNTHIKERLPETVQASLATFQESREAERREKTPRPRTFQATNAIRSKALAVFDPDTKRIVKQYSSKTAARAAALMLYEAGYACEWALSQSNLKARLDSAEDPLKPLFGYQWVPTEKLKRGHFKVKPYFRSDDLVSPTPNNIVILKEDTVSGVQLRGFESKESAYQDWVVEKSGSFNARVDQTDDGSAEESLSSEFVKHYLDGNKSINGIVWNRVDPDNGADVAAMMPKSPVGKVVMEEEHADMSPTRKVKSEENSLD